MASNKYSFYAWVDTPKIAQRIDIVSIGVWKQFSQGNLYPSDTMDKLEAMLKGMTSKGKSPFNFLWTPYIDKDKKVNQGTLFRTLSKTDRSTIELRIQRYDEKGTQLKGLYWNFYDVGIVRAYPNRKNEIVETTYSKFDMGSNQG